MNNDEYFKEDRIHTTIDKHLKKRLIEYGKGSIKKGIKNLVEIADSKRITINIITEVNIND